MIRRSISFLLIITVLATNFSVCLIYAGFNLNQKYIASSLCENKDKPMLHCNGRCYLAKKIKQAEDKEKSQEQQSQKNRFQEALITRDLKISHPFIFKSETVFYERSFDLPQHSSSIFHPPQV